jgi:hypothetical protein
MHVYVYIKGAVAIQVQKTDETEAVQLKKKTEIIQVFSHGMKTLTRTHAQNSL